MQTSHLMLIDGLLQNMREMPPEALEPFNVLKSEAKTRNKEWFNTAANVIEATTSVLEARGEVLRLLGDEATWENEPDSDVKQQRLRAAAELCAGEDCHREAIDVLRLYRRIKPQPSSITRQRQHSGVSSNSTPQRPTPRLSRRGSFTEIMADRVPLDECRDLIDQLDAGWQGHGTLLALVEACEDPEALIAELIRRVVPREPFHSCRWRRALHMLKRSDSADMPVVALSDHPIQPERPYLDEQVLAYYPSASKWLRSTFVRWTTGDGGGDGGGDGANAVRLAEVKLHGHKTKTVEHVLLLDDEHGAGALLREAAKVRNARTHAQHAQAAPWPQRCARVRTSPPPTHAATDARRHRRKPRRAYPQRAHLHTKHGCKDNVVPHCAAA
eukprot:5591738-Prymnesium_polylepis.1